ncbi:MAG: DUF2339 domain-containing protein [Sphingorhabdus sp.]
MEILLAIITLIVLVLGIVTANLSGSLGRMRSKLEELEELLIVYRGEGRPVSPPSESEKSAPPQTQPKRQAATVVSSRFSEEDETETVSVSEAKPDAAQRASDWISGRVSGFSLESLIGGKLPIWVGGIALAFAGFFMVRYSIEAGLFGPQARVISATLFGLLLIALSELGGKLPKIGASFSEDKRIAQSLAGAGIAILYATLYMASELYGLIGVGTAFLLVVVVTAIAFTLSLRHGPPTAIMGVVGGFAAPWIAEMGPDNMPMLLAYLGIFIAALFGLSIWRRWLWLLLLTTGGGALWTLALLASAETGLPLLGLFIALLGAAATFSALRLDGSDPRFTQIALFAPLGLALMQLAVLLPRLEFSPVGWALLGALCVMSLALAWRDKRLLPLAGIAAIIAIFPLYSGWNGAAETGSMTAASIGYGLLFGGAGHFWLVSKGKDIGWALLALLPPAAAYFAAYDTFFETGTSWGILAAALAIPMAYVAWQYRGEENPKRPVSMTACTLTAILLGTAMLLILPEDLMAAIFVLLAMLIAAWARFTDSRPVRRLAYIPLTTGILVMLAGAYEAIGSMIGTLSGTFAVHEYLPPVGEIAVRTLLPALMMAGMAIHPRFLVGSIGTRITLVAAATGGGIFLWLVSRQIFAISSPQDFVQFGFAERMMLTQLLAIAGIGLLWLQREKDSSPLRYAALSLLALALIRFVIFDLLLFNPAIREQALGPAPIANLATIHCALLAVFGWLAARMMSARGGVFGKLPFFADIASMLIVIIAALATVRQLIHGSIIAGGGVETSENYLYSVALIALALVWLTRGIMTSASLLRVAGLALLTLVTLKVFLIDAAALEGILRILSFLGLGIALIGIGWAYGRLMRQGNETQDEQTSQ